MDSQVGPALELPALGESVDVLLGLGLVELVLGLHPGHEVVLAFQRGNLGGMDFGHFWPISPRMPGADVCGELAVACAASLMGNLLKCKLSII